MRNCSMSSTSSGNATKESLFLLVSSDMLGEGGGGGRVVKAMAMMSGR